MTARLRLLRVCMAGFNARGYEAAAARLRACSNYEAACELLRNERLFYPSEFAAFMRERGFDVLESFWDLPELGRAWLRQVGEHRDIEPQGQDLIFSQIEEFRPDVIYFHPVFIIDDKQRRMIRERFPFVRSIGGYCGYLPDDLDFFSDCDFLFSAFKQPLQTWRSHDVAAHLLHHGFDDGFLSRGQLATPSADAAFTFFGATGWGFHTHFRRYRLMRRLLERTRLEVWGMEPEGLDASSKQPEQRSLWEKLACRYLNRASDRVPLPEMSEGELRPWFDHVPPLKSLFPERVHAPVFDAKYLSLLSASKLTVNCHTSISEEGLNMRLFEATGVGVCLLTDRRVGLEEVFEPDKEVMVYDTIAECIDKAKFLLRNDAVRRRIARAGQERTLRDHTSRQRLRVIGDTLQSLV